MQAAQLEKFPTFVEKRKENQKKLYDGLKDLEQLVETQPNSDPSWFGFMMTLKDGVRNELVEYLEANKIFLQEI
jgi:CDP-6-deoxy-D-xylo-4-hexulose-3-dehydrase